MKMTERQRKLVIPVLLAAILVIAFAVRAYRITDPIGGYHAFNEGFYTKIAATDMHRGTFDWLIAPLDRNNPPLYSLVVTILFLVFGESVALARLVSVVAGVATVYCTFLLGRTLYTERVGLLAAAILAVTPGFAIVNHNIQVDSLMFFFMIAGTYHYVRSIPDDDRKQALLGGALIGLGLATKLPAVLAPGVLALWETWRTHGVRWLRAKRVLPFIGGMLVFALPWYVARLVVDGTSYIGGQAALSGNATAVSSWSVFRWQVLNEMMWLLSPVLAALAVASIGYLLYKRATSDGLLLLSLAAYTGFYLVYNFHSYYLIPLAPFVALAVARATFALARKVPHIVWAHAVLLPFLLLATLLLLAGNKYGLWSPSQVLATLPVPPAEATIYDTSEVAGSYQPAIEYTLAPARVIELPEGFDLERDMPPAKTGKTYLLTSLEPRTEDGATPEYVAAYAETETGVVAFGFEFRQVPPNRHFFGNGVWQVRWVGAPYFGFLAHKLAIRPGDAFLRLYDADVVRDLTLR